MPIVAVMIPGYGEVVGFESIESDGQARRLRWSRSRPAAFGCGSVSQCQYSWKKFVPSCFAYPQTEKTTCASAR